MKIEGFEILCDSCDSSDCQVEQVHPFDDHYSYVRIVCNNCGSASDDDEGGARE